MNLNKKLEEHYYCNQCDGRIYDYPDNQFCSKCGDNVADEYYMINEINYDF